MNERDLTLSAPVQQKLALLGAVGQRWLANLDALIAELAQDWHLNIGASLHGGTEAYVAAVHLDDGTAAILKVAIPDHADNLGLAHEIAALTIAQGQGYARLLRADLDRRALLIERLGTPLSALGYATNDQIDLICATLQRSWIALPAAVTLPSGASAAAWFAQFITDLWESLARPCSQRALDHALRFAQSRAAAYDPAHAVLVHGDAHNNNTLQDLTTTPAAFKLIDPDGLAAEPAYDLGVLMREWQDELLPDPLRLGRERCAYLSHMTRSDPQPIWEWGYLQSMATGLILVQMGQTQAGQQMLRCAEEWARA